MSEFGVLMGGHSSEFWRLFGEDSVITLQPLSGSAVTLNEAIWNQAVMQTHDVLDANGERVDCAAIMDLPASQAVDIVGSYITRNSVRWYFAGIISESETFKSYAMTRTRQVVVNRIRLARKVDGYA